MLHVAAYCLQIYEGGEVQIIFLVTYVVLSFYLFSFQIIFLLLLYTSHIVVCYILPSDLDLLDLLCLYFRLLLLPRNTYTKYIMMYPTMLYTYRIYAVWYVHDGFEMFPLKKP